MKPYGVVNDLKLLEYQAKELFAKYGINVQKSEIISDKAGISETIAFAGLEYPLVIKAQVQIGGRGKAGGVRFAENTAQLQEITDSLLFSELKGLVVNKLLVEEKADIKTEWYLSILLDRDKKSPRVLFSASGGVDIEETAANNPEAIASVLVNPLTGLSDYVVRYVCSKSGIGDGYFDKLKDILIRMYGLFLEYSCILVEINPLVVKEDDKLLALDGKVDIDDSALFRLPDVVKYRDSLDDHPLVVEARLQRFLYIPLKTGSKVAVMSNGSGMIMSMIDLLNKEKIEVSCALDLGGGATSERIAEAVRITLATPGVDTLFICIFGGITRCDEVADGIKKAMEQAEGNKTIVIRMEGTNKNRGMEIIKTIPEAVSVTGIVDGVKTITRRFS